MATKVKLLGLSGNHIEFMDNGDPMQGGMKDVYFSPDKSYVVAFFRDYDSTKNRQAYNQLRDRMMEIVTTKKDGIFNQEGGAYWTDLLCWPYDLVEYNGKLGIAVPAYPSQFFFSIGSKNNDFLGIKGKEKIGKWFASPFHFNNNLDKAEKGDWYKYLLICLHVSRSARRLHSAGLAHSDLSYNNVLVDPTSGRAAVIDLDGLVVPGKFPPDVMGTPDFIAPEVLATKHLGKTDLGRKHPSIQTDRHALAVMIYMYLLHRHPLRGGKIHDADATKDEELGMGTKALFVEHPADRSNRPKLSDIKPSHLSPIPWPDVIKLPYNLCGPYLSELFTKSFIDGLHNPSARPSAGDWEHAILKTIDLIQPCQNSSCELKWYVFDNSTKPKCPFCGTVYQRPLPVLNLYIKNPAGRYTYENHRLMVYSGQNIYPWHVNKNIIPNERISPDQKQPVADFHFHQNKWILVNRKLNSLTDVSDSNRNIPIGQSIEITEGKQILLSKEEGGRLVIVQLVNNS
jgi:serine/threonine protein kinase